jgi:hypothetical protein
MALRQSALSLEYVRYQVTATRNGTSYDPTAGTVQFAFTAPGLNPSSWVTGAWESASGNYYATCLVGPSGATTLAPGEYQVWMKVSAAPESPVRLVGTITIF